MSNYDLEEDRLLKYQIFLSVIFIFTLIISITLSYNSMMEHKGKIYEDEDALNVLRINRLISFAVAVGFLFINVYDRELKDKYGYGSNNADLQILASLITLISSFIVLYIAFSSTSEIIQNENPEI